LRPNIYVSNQKPYKNALNSQELIDFNLDSIALPEKLSENPKKPKNKKTLILPKLAEESRRIGVENVKMLKRILN
jgi:hypothetical protein